MYNGTQALNGNIAPPLLLLFPYFPSLPLVLPLSPSLSHSHYQVCPTLLSLCLLLSPNNMYLTLARYQYDIIVNTAPRPPKHIAIDHSLSLSSATHPSLAYRPTSHVYNLSLDKQHIPASAPSGVIRCTGSSLLMSACPLPKEEDLPLLPTLNPTINGMCQPPCWTHPEQSLAMVYHL